MERALTLHLTQTATTDDTEKRAMAFPAIKPRSFPRPPVWQRELDPLALPGVSYIPLV